MAMDRLIAEVMLLIGSIYLLRPIHGAQPHGTGNFVNELHKPNSRHKHIHTRRGGGD
ncbi:hypothetical protein [Vulcanisaeta sp. JCM 16161]|uniref:hypothetical protein n=1 Tax=Vulcanisaeta sp. JCM 16161 TaxID=1295372 RepID=UPI001FB4F0C3|nr:hypothetical protein [Vulcanisaeta sp. JCM 16161]